MPFIIEDSHGQDSTVLGNGRTPLKILKEVDISDLSSYEGVTTLQFLEERYEDNVIRMWAITFDGEVETVATYPKALQSEINPSIQKSGIENLSQMARSYRPRHWPSEW